MRRMMYNALVTLLALLLSVGTSWGEEKWDSCQVGTIEWSCQKIGNTETCKIKPKPGEDIKGAVTIPSEVTIDGKTLKVVTVAERAFWLFTELTEVNIPEGVETIENSAFTQCRNLGNVTFSAGLKRIGESAFVGTMLKTVALPEGLTSIGGHAFSACDSLERVELHEGLTSIGASAFAYSSKLSEVTIPTSVTEIGMEAFSSTALTSVAIPAGVKELPGAFKYCNNLEKVTLSEGLKILDHTFSSCAKLTEITIPASVDSIGVETFSSTALTSVVIPAGVKELPGAFKYCPNLEKVTLSEGLKVLAGTFSGCEKLTEITIPASVDSITGYTFSGCRALNKVYYLAAADAAVADNAFDGIANPDTLFVRKGEEGNIKGNGKAWKEKFKVIEERNVVTFDADGGLPTPAAQWLKDNNKHAEIPTIVPVKKGFKFEGWTLLSGEDYHFDTQVQGNIALKAKYAAVEYTLTITSGANGSVKVTRDNAQGDALTDGAKLKEGDKLFIAATPAEGYELETLTVNGNDQANSSVFTVGTENVEVAAAFKAKGGATPPAAVEYTLTITAGANGSVKVTRDNAQGDALTSGAKLKEGDKLFIAATSAEGYELETLTANGAAQANSSVFTVGKANVEVKASFKKKGGAAPPSAVESVLLAAARVVQNPIANALVLEGISTAERIEVYSLTGVQTYACALRGEERVEIATGSWASGFYVVRIIAADGEKTIRVVKR